MMKTKIFGMLWLFGGCFALSTVNAVEIPITNGSFELPPLTDGEIGFSAPPGWAGGGTENHNRPIFGGAEASDGENVYWNNIGFGPSGAEISDVVGVLLPGDYTLSVDFLFRTDSISTDSLPDTDFGLTLDGATFLGTPTTVTDALDVGGAGLISTQTYSLNVPIGDPNVGSPYAILFLSTQNNLGTWNQLAFDNVRLDAPIPEPASLALLGLACTAGVGTRRRRS